MVFSTYPMTHGASAQSGVQPREIGFTLVTRNCDPDVDFYVRRPCIEACTATNEEIEAREADGEFDFDVIDEHVTLLWFSDRHSFRAAWAIARRICKGWKLSGIKAGEISAISAIGFQRCGRNEIISTPGLTVEISGHHVAEAA